MRSTRYLLVAMAIAGSVGCGGARISELEGELASCKETSTTQAAENAKLQEANAAMKPKADQHAQIASERQQLHDDLQAGLLPLIDASRLTLGIRNGVVTISIPSESVFKSRSNSVSREGKVLLVEVASMLKHFSERKFMVAVHEDSRSVKKKRGKGRDNLDFTTQRAYQAYAIISAAGVSKENLAVGGFGAGYPIADNATEGGQVQNRRLEIMAIPPMEAAMPAETAAE